MRSNYTKIYNRDKKSSSRVFLMTFPSMKTFSRSVFRSLLSLSLSFIWNIIKICNEKYGGEKAKTYNKNISAHIFLFFSSLSPRLRRLHFLLDASSLSLDPFKSTFNISSSLFWYFASFHIPYYIIKCVYVFPFLCADFFLPFCFCLIIRA